MIRQCLALLGIVGAIAVPAYAGESHNAGIGSSRTDLVRSRFDLGRSSIEVMAGEQVDINSLLADVDLSTATSAQAISDLINEKRLALYPDEEIILSVAPSQDSRPGNTEKVSLVRAIFWWNNTNCSSCYWSAEYASTTATLFVGRVQYGSYKVYDKPGGSSWINRFTLGAGGGGTLYNYGPKTNRGFRGYANGVASKTDIVMYFFN